VTYDPPPARQVRRDRATESFGFEESALVAMPPSLGRKRVEQLVAEHYGIQTVELAPLGSERDQNLRLTNGRGTKFVVRITNSSEEKDVTALQTSAHLHLEQRAPDVPVQRIVRTASGDGSVDLSEGDGGSVLRVMSYIEGKPLSNWTTPSRMQCASLGRVLAEFDLAMRHFSHPAGQHELMWNLANAAKVHPLLCHLEDTVTRVNAGRLLVGFERDVLPVLEVLRAQIIHNDPNPHNILFDPLDPARVTGILDLGDILQAPLVVDLAIAASALPVIGDDPLALASEMFLAFHAALPLEEREVASLFDLMCARQVMSLAVAAWRVQMFPENSTYILKNSERAMQNVNAFASIDRGQARDHFLNLCNR